MAGVLLPVEAGFVHCSSVRKVNALLCEYNPDMQVGLSGTGGPQFEHILVFELNSEEN